MSGPAANNKGRKELFDYGIRREPALQRQEAL